MEPPRMAGRSTSSQSRSLEPPRGGAVELGMGNWNNPPGLDRVRVGTADGPIRLLRASERSDHPRLSEHAGNVAHSGLLSAGYFGDHDILKLTAMAGRSRNELAYLASPDSTLARDPRDNPPLAQRTRRFWRRDREPELHALINAASSLSATVYGITATGWYDVKSDTVLDNYHLDFLVDRAGRRVHVSGRAHRLRGRRPRGGLSPGSLSVRPARSYQPHLFEPGREAGPQYVRQGRLRPRAFLLVRRRAAPASVVGLRSRPGGGEFRAAASPGSSSTPRLA